MAQSGSVLVWGARGRGFKSRYPDNKKALTVRIVSAFSFLQQYKKTAFMTPSPASLTFEWFLGILNHSSIYSTYVQQLIFFRSNSKMLLKHLVELYARTVAVTNTF